MSSYMALVEAVILKEKRIDINTWYFIWRKALKSYDNVYADMPPVQPTVNRSAGSTQWCKCPQSEPCAPVPWLQLPVKSLPTVVEQVRGMNKYMQSSLEDDCVHMKAGARPLKHPDKDLTWIYQSCNKRSMIWRTLIRRQAGWECDGHGESKLKWVTAGDLLS